MIKFIKKMNMDPSDLFKGLRRLKDMFGYCSVKPRIYN